MKFKRVFRGLVCLSLFTLFASAPVQADITYTLHLGGVDAGIASQLTNSMQEAVATYNKYGSFNKHLNAYYNAGVPTAQANYDGVITFGGSRNTRVALHEMGHTVGVGTYWGSPSYSSLMVGGVWQGYYGRKLAIEMGGYGDGLHGDGTHIWPWGLNYDSEDSFMDRIKHVRIMAAVRCDMGIMAFAQEAEHQSPALGETAVFAVWSPLASSYRWYKDGAALVNGGDIAGATGPTLRIANADLSDEGMYYCEAAGAGETLNSRPRRLTIQRCVSRLEFEGNVSSSSGPFSGTAFGSPGYVTGVSGQAINLDGVDDRIILPEGLADAEDMTIMTWVSWDGGGAWQRIFDFGTGTSQYMFLTPSSGSVMRFAIKNGGSEQVVSTSILPTVQGVHLAVVLKRDCATLYVNGRPAATNNAVTINPRDFSPTLNFIGDSQFGADPSFDGRLDDFRVYNCGLRGSEIWDIWGRSANAAPTFMADPVILPAADENQPYSGLTLADYASDADGDALTFTKIGGPAWLQIAANGVVSGIPGTGNRGQNIFVVRVSDPSGATDDVMVHVEVAGSPDVLLAFDGNADDGAGSSHGTASGSPAFSAGVLGQAMDFDGTNDYVTLPAGILNTADFTAAAWVNWNGGAVYDRIFDFGNNTTQYTFLTPNSGSGTLRFAMTATGGGTREQKLETAALTPGQWTHVAVTLKGDVGKLYVNGQLKDVNAAMTINPADFNPALNYIGKSQWPDPLFRGKIDDFRLYRHALTDAQVAALSLPPSFADDPIVNDNTVELSAYAGQSLTAYTADSPGIEALTYSKVSGPDWLVVSPDGTLGGIPSNSDVGTNAFVVRVVSPAGLSDTATMTVNVANIYSGTQGMTDLLGLAANWLAGDCTEIPPCRGADLDVSADVDLSDYAVLAHNWMIDERLQLHLRFDESGGDIAADSSIYRRDSLLVNGPARDLSQSGAIVFDGVNDYISVSGYKGIAGSGRRTCCAWIKTGGSPANSVIMDWGTAAAGQRWLFGLFSNGQVTLYSQGPYICTTGTVNDDQWHHVAVVFADDGTPEVSDIQLYIDGTLQAITVSASTILNTGLAGNVTVGAYNNAGTMAGFFNGLIDDIRIYSEALTATEIQEIAAEAF